MGWTDGFSGPPRGFPVPTPVPVRYLCLRHVYIISMAGLARSHTCASREDTRADTCVGTLVAAQRRTARPVCASYAGMHELRVSPV